MSARVMLWVLDFSQAQGTDKLIEVCLARHANDEGRNAWPSRKTLAGYANVSERAVQRSLRRLEAIGRIKTYKNQGGDADTRTDMRPNRYEILMPETGEVLTPPTLSNGKTLTTPTQPNGEALKAQRGVVEGPSGESLKPPEMSFDTSITSPIKNKGKKSNVYENESTTIPEALAQLDGFVENWMSYLEMRTKSKKHGTVTPRVAQMAFKKLLRLEAAGFDAVKLLERSTLSGWGDFFERDQDRRTVVATAKPINTRSSIQLKTTDEYEQQFELEQVAT